MTTPALAQAQARAADAQTTIALLEAGIIDRAEARDRLGITAAAPTVSVAIPSPMAAWERELFRGIIPAALPSPKPPRYSAATRYRASNGAQITVLLDTERPDQIASFGPLGLERVQEHARKLNRGGRRDAFIWTPASRVTETAPKPKPPRYSAATRYRTSDGAEVVAILDAERPEELAYFSGTPLSTVQRHARELNSGVRGRGAWIWTGASRFTEEAPKPATDGTLSTLRGAAPGTYRDQDGDVWTVFADGSRRWTAYPDGSPRHGGTTYDAASTVLDSARPFSLIELAKPETVESLVGAKPGVYATPSGDRLELGFDGKVRAVAGCSSCPHVERYAASEEDGRGPFTLVTETPAPTFDDELPTEPGLYRAANGSVWELHEDGDRRRWTVARYHSQAFRPRAQRIAHAAAWAKEDLPFTRVTEAEARA